MIVIDASALLHILLTPAVDPHVLAAVEAAGELAAPHLIDAEILDSLRRQVDFKEMKPTLARQALDGLNDINLNRWPVQPLNDRIWEPRHNLTAYDAPYVALAEMLSVPLYTRDAGIAALKTHRAKVVHL